MLTVQLPDGSEKQFDHSVTPRDVAADIGPGLAKAALAAQVDGNVVGLDYPLPGDGAASLRLLTRKDPGPCEVRLRMEPEKGTGPCFRSASFV